MSAIMRCVICNRTAIVLQGDTPYCIKCYRKEVNVNRRYKKDGQIAKNNTDNRSYRR